MLYGGRITVFTDHKNLTFKTLSIQRVLRWRLYMDQFDLQLKFIAGKDNVLADCFSRLPRMAKDTGENSSSKITTRRKRNGRIVDFHNLRTPENEGTLIGDEVFVSDNLCGTYLGIDEDNTLMESFLNLPHLTFDSNPLSMNEIHNHQSQSESLQELAANDPNQFPTININGFQIITILGTVPQQPTLWKICIPQSLIQRMIKWFHETLGHCGVDRLYNTIRNRFHCDRLYTHCRNFRCDINCTQYKSLGQGYGKHPSRNVLATPWDEVAVDLVGPWSIQLEGIEYEFNALTCIDPVTNLVEIIRINSKTSQHITEQFENLWLSRYPSPNRCVHDRGGEFMGHEFQNMLARHAIKNVPITTRNPQSNAICERMHSTIGNVLRIIMRTTDITNVQQAAQVADNALATCMHSTRCAVHQALQTSPGALVYRRDMFVDVPVMADLVAIRQRRQQLVDQNLIRHNRKRYDHHYRVGDPVMIIRYDPTKLQERLHGPYPIVEIRTNGTVSLQRRPGISESYNIRKLRPYKGPDEATLQLRQREGQNQHFPQQGLLRQ